MQIRSKVLVWYGVFLTLVVITGIAAGTILYNSLLASGNEPSTAWWLSLIWIIPCIVAASVGGTYYVIKKFSEPIKKLNHVTQKAEQQPLSNSIPELIINSNDDIAVTVTAIHNFINERHQKLQQVLHFSSLASHELRTPLTIIRNQLEDGMRSDVTLDQLNAIVTSTYDEIIRLHHLVNDLLTISTLQAGTLKLEKKTVNFHSFIKEFYDEALFLSREKNIAIVLSKGPQVTLYCEPDRLRQVLFNLLENALKYTSEQGRVYISYFIDDANLYLKIADTGSGIPRHKIDNIFEPFYQVARHDQSVHQGAGLGLSLVRWIVDAHGGSVDVESEEGKGTTFTIRLPRGN